MSFKATCIILPEHKPAEFILVRPEATIQGVKTFISEPGFLVWRPFNTEGRNKKGKNKQGKGRFIPQPVLEILGINDQHLVIESHATKTTDSRIVLHFSWTANGGPVQEGDFPVFQGGDGLFYKIKRPFRFSSNHLFFDLYQIDLIAGDEKLVGIKTLPDISIY